MDIETEAVAATLGGKRPGEEPTALEKAYRTVRFMAEQKSDEDTRLTLESVAGDIRQAAIYDAQRTAVWKGMERDVADATRLYHIEKHAQRDAQKKLARAEKISLALAALVGLLVVSVAGLL